MDEKFYRIRLLLVVGLVVVVLVVGLLVFTVPLANSAFLKEVKIISYGVLIKERNL